MAADSVGQVSLELTIDTKLKKQIEDIASQMQNRMEKQVEASGKKIEKSFKSCSNSVEKFGKDAKKASDQASGSMSKLAGVAKKIGGIIGGAFAVKKIIDFGKDCLELGSDLAEVQNVVDTAFPGMKNAVNEFAQSAATGFGLSETMAKRYVGTFGSMANAFGFSQQEAYDMSTTLTKLSGDVASFYNLSQDEAYTKLKSVFTGETESLKDLGVVMTQTALDQYALANGFGKTTQQMTEQQKVALRYSFVREQLKLADDDFRDTSNFWANQVRILNLQFDSLKASIGQGLINLFTPIIKVINQVVARLSTLANAFKAFTELITGKKSGGSSVSTAASDLQDVGQSASGAASGISDATDATKGLEKATGKAGDAAEKAAKQALGLMGFDAINKLTDNAASSGSGGSGGGGSGGSGGGGGLGGDAVDYGSLAEGETELDAVNEQFQKIIDRFKELQALFEQGFNIGLGDTSVFDSIEASLQSIRDSFVEIFTNEDLIDTANAWMDNLALNLGKTAGSIVSVGATIADNLLGGLAQYLEENTDRITQYLIDMLDIDAEINTLVADFMVAFADIFAIFRSDDAKAITSDFISIFNDGFMGVTELAAKIGRDIIDLITTPITENADKIKDALANTLAPLRTVFDSLAQAWQDLWDEIQALYDNHVKPLFDSVTAGFSEIVGTFVDSYNENMAPVLQKMADKFAEVVEQHVQPMLEKLGDALGSILDLIKTLWETILQPLFNWIADNIWPVLSDLAEMVGSTLLDAVAGMSDRLSAILDVISTVADGLNTLIKGIKEFIENVAKLPEKVSLTITAAKDAAWDKIKEAWDNFKNSEAVKSIKASVASAYTSAKEAYEKFKNSDAVKSIKSSVSEAYTKAKNAYENFKSGTITKSIKSSVSNAYTSAKKTWDKFKSNSITKSLKVSGTSAVNKAKKAWDSLKSKSINLALKLNGAVNNVKGTVNGVISSINSNVISKIKLTAPSNWPIVGGKSIGPPPTIPYLAEGGFVKANTPRLAVIGDNTKYGEIVAPENKLAAMAKQAAEEAKSSGDMLQVVALLQQIVQLLSSMNMDLYMDGNKVTKTVINRINEITASTGKCPIRA